MLLLHVRTMLSIAIWSYFAVPDFEKVTVIPLILDVTQPAQAHSPHDHPRSGLSVAAIDLGHQQDYLHAQVRALRFTALNVAVVPGSLGLALAGFRSSVHVAIDLARSWARLLGRTVVPQTEHVVKSSR